MNREYHRWYSERLHREMELLVFGHGGAKVLVFPTRDGRFYEYENLGVYLGRGMVTTPYNVIGNHKYETLADLKGSKIRH